MPAFPLCRMLSLGVALLALRLGGIAVAQEVTFTVNAVPDGVAIPASVYGSNELGYSGASVNRHGGNRHTGFNWENNASNAGSDYIHSSDSYLGSLAGIGSTTTPGAVLQAWVNADRAQGVKSMLTLPLAGYVAADLNGTVSAGEAAPSARWKQVVAKKSGVFSVPPNTTDGAVYLDEMVNFLVTKFGTAAAGGVAAYCLDNEPGLWSSTHPRIHAAATGYQELATKHQAAAAAALAVDPTAEIYGPVSYGWSEHLNLQNAPDASTYNGTYGNFTNYYLAQMKAASTTAGRRLLHRYDMHWYPEARGDHRIVFEGTTPDYGTANDIDARLQAPRSLWDATYVETSWITQYTTNGQGIRLLARFRESVDQYYPGTGLAMTEYNYGGTGHISGGVAQADVLGILGENGAAGNFWPITGDNSYVAAAFRLYRNYDGAGAAYGDRSLAATASDAAKAGVHAARAGAGGLKVTVVAVNRSRTLARTAKVQLVLPTGQAVAAVKVFRLDGSGAQVQALGAVAAISGSSFTHTLPAMSATLYEVALQASFATWQQQVFAGNAGNATIAGETADPDRDGVSNLVEFATGRDALRPDAAPVLGVAGSSLQFTRRKGLSETQLLLQSSATLAANSWVDLDPAALSPTREEVDGVVERWTIVRPQPSGTPTFYRLKAVKTVGTAAATAKRAALRMRR